MTLKDNIQDIKQKKRSAQKALFDAFAKVFYRLSLRYVCQQQDAEDCVLESFMKIFEGIETFQYQSEAQTEAWMKRIVVNQSLKTLRKRNALFIVQLPNEDFCEDLEDSVNNEISAKELLELIAQLPDGYRTVFNMYEIEGYTHQEIAHILNITEATSRSQLFKAKRLLKEKLTRALTK